KLSVCPPVSLTVSPNLQQFFTGASVSLTCEGQLGSDGWTVKRDTGSGNESCGAGGRGFGRFNGSSCLFDEFKPVSGVYWCEGEAGEKSEEVNITVSGNEVIHLIIRLTAHCYTTSTSLCVFSSGKEVILEIPALPVRTGSDVTLRCKKKTGGTAAAYFYCNGRPVRPKSEHIITIDVQQSDEGLYWCANDEFGLSPQSYLRVRGPPTKASFTTKTTAKATTTATTITTHISHPSPPPPSSSSSIVLVMAAVVFLCLLDLFLVVVLLTGWRQTGMKCTKACVFELVMKHSKHAKPKHFFVSYCNILLKCLL
uniref:Immunoglobulin domain-containing protein n=1 Tax=Oreochromis niloticus TaxID=8128 RepID=A0A669C699_ORENI